MSGAWTVLIFRFCGSMLFLRLHYHYMPNRSHAFSGEPYFIRRSRDFFVRNLLHQEPPRDYQFESAN